MNDDEMINVGSLLGESAYMKWSDDHIFNLRNRIPDTVRYTQQQMENGIQAADRKELRKIALYYEMYKRGVRFTPEGHLRKYNTTVEESGEMRFELTEDYQPACMLFKKVKQLIDKQARFMFGRNPDIRIETAMDVEDEDSAEFKQLSIYNEFIDNVLEENYFNNQLLKASKDCFIGKRVAAVINFDGASGIQIDFLSSFHFQYEFDVNDKNKLVSFVYFKKLCDGDLPNQRFFRKQYTLEKVVFNDGSIGERCFVTEQLFDGDGQIVEDESLNLLNDVQTLLDFIPAVVIFNDGLLDEVRGVSDVRGLEIYEQWYNMLNCLDIDALRKNMNAMKYTIDMDQSTTKFITNAPGGYADLMSDKDPDNNVDIGMLESSMNYKDTLDDILKRINEAMYDSIDMPDISIENIAGTITSGKALKAIYWGLIARCDEKMNIWAPAIKKIIKIVIDGAKILPMSAERYLYGEALGETLDYSVYVERKDPIPDDEEDEKKLDMEEVALKLMSRQSYLVKWRNMTRTQANKELIQIAVEDNILNDAALPLDALDDNELAKQIAELGDATNLNTVVDENIDEISVNV